jgi:TetR/AcrR family transcriptional repressor of mexJK operon
MKRAAAHPYLSTLGRSAGYQGLGISLVSYIMTAGPYGYPAPPLHKSRAVSRLPSLLIIRRIMTTSPEAPQETRQRVLEAACEAFREEGYQVSIDRIAARAQVARQTLYNHFPSKEALFEEVVHHAIQSILVTLDGETEVRATLLAFGNAYREKLLSPEGLALFRTMTAEAPRFPELAKQFFRQGPLTTRKRLAAYLARVMETGALRKDDPDFAAEMLTAMLADFDRLRGLINLQTDLARPAKTVQVVDSFLRAFAP